MNEKEQIERANKQVVEIVLTQPFFASLLLYLKREYTAAVPTMATDGERLFINPGFVAGLKDPEIRGVLVHEVLHAALGHPWRLGDRDPKKANIAMDYAINLIVEEYATSGGKVALPAGALLDHQYAGMAWETIYNKLPAGGSGGGSGANGQGSGADGAGMGEVLPGACGTDPETGKPMTPDEMAASWRVRAAQAAQAAKMQGNLPACMERLVGDLVSPKVPWRQLLRKFLTERERNDYDFLRPDRRFLPADVYIPDIGDEEAATNITVAVDTSGSIDGDMLDAFFSEIDAIHKDIRPKKLRVIYCDAAVHEPVDEFAPEDRIVARPKGGGGTSFGPLFDYIEAERERPTALVYLTDLHGDHWPKVPDYPVLWACWSTRTDAPFGDVITVD